MKPLNQNKMKQTAVEWLVSQLNKEGFAQVVTDEELEQAKEMEKNRETRIKELETFLQEDILDDVYYYHSPIWYRATELLNQNKDKDE